MWSDAELLALVRDLRPFEDVDVMVDAASRLHSASAAADVPRLTLLLHDDSFLVREAPARPLASLAGVALLPDLLRPFQRGSDDGHDNDGFTTALTELVELDKEGARSALTRLVASGEDAMREIAELLLESCEPAQ